MRRLLLVLAALAVLFPAGAVAAKPAHLVVVRGSAQAANGKLSGWFVVGNRGDARSQFADVSVNVNGGIGRYKVKVRWRAGQMTIPGLAPAQTYRVRFAIPIPESSRITHGSIEACAESCRRIGRFEKPWSASSPASAPAPVPAPSPFPEPSPPSPPPPPHDAGALPPPSDEVPPLPVSTVPNDPIPYEAGTPFEVTDGPVPYWAFVPETYDPSDLTPAPLLIWLHGCGGYSDGDIWVVDPGASGGSQDWLTIAVGGREGDCWTPSADEAKVMAALADFETHFNVDRSRVILAGYSSGGDLAYRTAFRHSTTFEGLLIENSSPFRDTDSTPAQSLAAATTKFPIVHLAHTGDTTYPLANVQKEVAEAKAAGFPIELIQRPGTHYDSHTDSDLVEYLLPYIDGGWPG